MAFLVTLEIASIWFLEAISGTTPPYFSCIGICVSIILERTSLPFFTIDTEVSSQLDSIPKVNISFSIIIFLYYFIFYYIPKINAPKFIIPDVTTFITGDIIILANPVINIITNII